MHEVMAKGILSASNGMNIYRGCQHGCIYCDARSKCYQMQHAFEDIEVKVNAPELLEQSLSHKRKKCMVGTGAMSDPYIPLEMQLQNTRKCLEIIDKYECGLAIQTKSASILRDLDLLKSINQKAKCVVQMTLTTYDEQLCRIVEPNVSTTRERFEALKVFRDNGIQTVVWFSPILPFINDTEDNYRGILDYCIEAKVYAILYFGAGMTLREGDREYFYQKLDEHFPGMKERYIRTYGNAYEIVSPHHKSLNKLLYQTCRENGIMAGTDKVFSYLHTYECKNYEQMTLGF